MHVGLRSLLATSPFHSFSWYLPYIYKLSKTWEITYYTSILMVVLCQYTAYVVTPERNLWAKSCDHWIKESILKWKVKAIVTTLL